jgi:hypothetical protein
MGARDFDPDALADAEYAGWVAYYRREWRAFLRAALAMVRIGFGMSWPRTVRGAWYVLRANQVWAPYPVNDAPRAREYMRRFYALVIRDGGLSLDPGEAARREVEWWRAHRRHQREPNASGDAPSDDELTTALVELYSYVYDAAPQDVREAAQQRVLAMDHSDAWVAAGCRLDDPRLPVERAALLASYRALRAAVGSQTGQT